MEISLGLVINCVRIITKYFNIFKSKKITSLPELKFLTNELNNEESQKILRSPPKIIANLKKKLFSKFFPDRGPSQNACLYISHSYCMPKKEANYLGI